MFGNNMQQIDDYLSDEKLAELTLKIFRNPGNPDNYLNRAVFFTMRAVNRKVDQYLINFAFDDYVKYIEKLENKENGYNAFFVFLTEMDEKILAQIDKEKFRDAVYKLDKKNQHKIMKLCINANSTLNKYLLDDEYRVVTSFLFVHTWSHFTADMPRHKGFPILQTMKIDYCSIDREIKSQIDSKIKYQLDKFDEMIRENPDDPDNYFQRAVFCEGTGFNARNPFLIKTAFYDYVEFIKRIPGNRDGHRNLANLLMKIDNPILINQIKKMDLCEAITNLLQDEEKNSIIKLCTTENQPLNELLLSEEVHPTEFGIFAQEKMVKYDDKQHKGRQALDNMFEMLNQSNNPIETIENYYDSNLMM